jgi:hypothetical protein
MRGGQLDVLDGDVVPAIGNGPRGSGGGGSKCAVEGSQVELRQVVVAGVAVVVHGAGLLPVNGGSAASYLAACFFSVSF